MFRGFGFRASKSLRGLQGLLLWPKVVTKVAKLTLYGAYNKISRLELSQYVVHFPCYWVTKF